MLTAQESIIEHTIRLSQFLFDALDMRDARKEPQSFDPKSIKDKVEEVGTMSKGDAQVLSGNNLIKCITVMICLKNGLIPTHENFDFNSLCLQKSF